MSKELNMVCVEWRDARLFSGTYNDEATRKHQMASFKSLGYLISKDKVTTKLAAEINDEGEYRDVLLIPTGSIVSVTNLITRSTM